MIFQLALICVLSAALLVVTAKIVGLAHATRRAELAVTDPEPPLKAAPEPRVPLDTSRPYPRPGNSRSKLNKACPVCGTGDTTGSLDGKVLGWPAHASCAEWLGNWKPPSAEVRELQRHLDAHTAENGTSWPPGIPAPSASPDRDDSFPVTGKDDLARAQELVMRGPAYKNTRGADTGAITPHMLMNGPISPDEAREWLDREVTASFGMPGPVLGGADSAALGHLIALQEMFLDSETRACRVPPFEARSAPCPDCGTYFEGTAEGVAQSLDRHRGSARCAEHRKLRGR